MKEPPWLLKVPAALWHTEIPADGRLFITTARAVKKACKSVMRQALQFTGTDFSTRAFL